MSSRLLNACAAVLFVLGLAACSSDGGEDGGPPSPAGIEVVGDVQAPSGVLAKAPTTFKQWFASLLTVADSHALDIPGWSPVSGATVRAFLIDDAGNPTGPILATATTNATGNFILTLPDGTPFSSNLIAQVENDPNINGPVPIGTANTLSTPIFSGVGIDLNPAMEAATRALVARSEPLANFTYREVAQYLNAISVLVLANPPGPGTLAATIAQITAAFGPQMAAGLDAVSGTGPNSLVFLTSSLPNGTQGVAYSVLVAAIGGTTEPSSLASSWVVSAGALPDGLEVGSAHNIPTAGRIGWIRGNPTAPGTFTFTLRVQDSASPPQSASRAFSIVVDGGSPVASVQSLTPATQNIRTGGTGDLTVTLNLPQSTNTTVTLAATPGGIVTIPATVQVPANQLAASFPVTGFAAGSTQISATLGTSSASAAVTVTADPLVTSLTPPTQLIQVGTEGALTVTLNAAQSTATTVTLAATPGGIVTIPATVQVPANQLAASFPVTGFAAGTTQISAMLGTSSAAAGVTVTPDPFVTSLTPSTQLIQVGTEGALTVTLNAAQSTDTTVTLAANPGGIVTIPATMQVPANQVDASFPITGLAAGSTQISATLGASSAAAGVTVVTSTPSLFNLTGIWTNDFSCVPSPGDPFTGQEIVIVTQSGVNVTLSSGAFLGTGTLNGFIMDYTGSGSGYTESGQWTRQGNDDLLAKTSTYENANGSTGACTGTLQRHPLALVDKIAAGSNHTFALKPDGTLWGWGNNANGQLGDDTQTRRLIPTQIGTATWRTIATAVRHTMAIRSDGTLWAWGDNASGQLGDATQISRLAPTQIGTDTNWSAIALGTAHSVALKTDGTLWAWGLNATGQLGNATQTDRHTPTQIGTANNWSAIAAGREHTVARQTNGTLWAWGLNATGQLGLPAETPVPNCTCHFTPTQVGTATNWSAIAAGIRYTIALQSNGTLWAWGENGAGQLGDGTLTTRLSPTQIGTATNWSTIAAGSFNTSLALKADGTLWAWGDNANGQLGDGTQTNRRAPTLIGTASTWSALAVGTYHSVALRTDGTLWAWGSNLNGEHGDGTRVSPKLTPTQIPF